MMSDGPGKTILGWWSREIGDRTSSAARAQAARLNRGTVLDVLSEPAVHELSRRLELRDPERLARLVQVLAAVRSHDRLSLSRRLGGPEPALSPLRFQRLIRSEGDDLVTALRRALPMVERRCDVAALGTDLLHWTDATRARWCFHYFGQPAPEAVPASEEQEP